MSTEHLPLCLSVEKYVYWVTGLEHLCSNTMVEIKREGLRLPSNRPELLEAGVVGSVHWPAMYYCKQANKRKTTKQQTKTNKQTPALVVDDPAETQSWLQSSVPQVQTELVWGINFNILLRKMHYCIKSRSALPPPRHQDYQRCHRRSLPQWRSLWHTSGLQGRSSWQFCTLCWQDSRSLSQTRTRNTCSPSSRRSSTWLVNNSFALKFRIYVHRLVNHATISQRTCPCSVFFFPSKKCCAKNKDKIFFSLDGVVRRALCGLIFSTGAGPVLVARTSMAVAEVQGVSFGLFAYYHLFPEYLQHRSPLPPWLSSTVWHL